MLKFFQKIQVQMALYILTLGFIILTLSGSILYFSISNIILEESIANAKSSIEKTGNYVDHYIRQLKSLSLLLAEDSNVEAYFSDENLDSEDAIDKLIRTTLKGNPFIRSVTFVGKNGSILSNEESLHMSTSYDMMKEEWYVKAISDEMPVLTSARQQTFNMDKDNWVISLSRELKNTQGENIGVLLLDMDYTFLEDTLQNLDLGNEGYAFILNKENQVVYHKDASYFMNQEKQAELTQLLKGKKGYDSKSNTLIQSNSLLNCQWYLVGVSSLDRLYQVKRQVIEALLLTSIILFVSVGFLGSFMASKITNPIRLLEKAMTDLEDGLKEVPIQENGCYEAKSLSLHFNSMVNKISMLMEDVAEQQRSIKNYEIKVLQSQINPHFLYNTLDTIVWMAEFNDSEKVIAITKALANFFRLSLSGGSELTTLHHEMKHVEDYLFIQQQRYGDALQYSINYHDEQKDIEIPKIILQPFVENAIYHGLKNKGGKIDITAHLSHHDLLITIKDNGMGFDVNASNNESKAKHVKLGGVGISNVSQRLKLYYGSDYGVSIESKPGSGTTVTLKLKEQPPKSL